MKRDRDTEIETGKHTDGGTETIGQQTSLDGSVDVRTPAAPILAITGESIGKLVREHADYHSKNVCKDGQGTEQILQVARKACLRTCRHMCMPASCDTHKCKGTS